MAGTFSGTKPKAFNRHFFINVGTSEAPTWAELLFGISSRGVDISEDAEEYFYMDGRGTADSESSSQTITRTFSGNRFLGDAAQDAIFIDRMYTLDKRQVEFMEYYDTVPASWADKGNGYKGLANIQISDDGGGDTGVRESIEFSLLYSGQPTRGTVTVGSDGTPTFEELAEAPTN